MATRATQRGKYFHGTSGYPIRIRLGIALSDLLGITITLVRPGGGTVERQVQPSAVVDEAKGVFDFIPQQGDLPVAGTYVMRIAVRRQPVSPGAAERILTTEASFVVG